MVHCMSAFCHTSVQESHMSALAFILIAVQLLLLAAALRIFFHMHIHHHALGLTLYYTFGLLLKFTQLAVSLVYHQQST